MFKPINGGKLPQRATKYSAGFDVFANEDVVIGAGETKLIGLGIAIDLQKYYECFDKSPKPSFKEAMEKDPQDFFFVRAMREYYLELHIRSSLRVEGLTSLGTGIIDIDYPDEIKMVVHNPVKEFSRQSGYAVKGCSRKFKKGDKIGQLILKRHEGYRLPQEYTLDVQRTSGFGSTGA